jgi:hypothetical protein
MHILEKSSLVEPLRMTSIARSERRMRTERGSL